jgi:hypothetical protein
MSYRPAARTRANLRIVGVFLHRKQTFRNLGVTLTVGERPLSMNGGQTAPFSTQDAISIRNK